MPVTASSQTGDGIVADFVDFDLVLPDAGTAVAVSGRVQPVGGASVNVSGSPLTMPTAPASGSTFWNVQVDMLSGLATAQSSPTADPAPVSLSARVVFRQTLSTTSTNPALTPESTPDTW